MENMGLRMGSTGWGVEEPDWEGIGWGKVWTAKE